jgi:hypothetical protein
MLREIVTEAIRHPCVHHLMEREREDERDHEEDEFADVRDLHISLR